MQRCKRGCPASYGALVWIFLLSGCCLIPDIKPSPCTCGYHAPKKEEAKCSPQLAFADRLNRGYTIVLPGIWGAQAVDYGIVRGLQEADTQSAIELHDWTAGELRLLYNLRAIDHNKREARKIAAKIINYQNRYPGKPVHLVGYSGGGGVALFALESLPKDRSITSAVLLAPTVASDYDLRPALKHATHGIHNFYSSLDVPILMVLCTAFGTTEGQHTLAAGAIGFQTPKDVAPETSRAYKLLVSQQAYTLDMANDGHMGGHFGWANPTFIAHHVAPLIAASNADKKIAKLN